MNFWTLFLLANPGAAFRFKYSKRPPTKEPTVEKSERVEDAQVLGGVERTLTNTPTMVSDEEWV